MSGQTDEAQTGQQSQAVSRMNMLHYLTQHLAVIKLRGSPDPRLQKSSVPVGKTNVS
jgi:hypothetical protein